MFECLESVVAKTLTINKLVYRFAGAYFTVTKTHENKKYKKNFKHLKGAKKYSIKSWWNPNNAYTHNLKRIWSVSRPQINEMECNVMNEQQLNGMAFHMERPSRPTLIECKRIFSFSFRIDVDIQIVPQFVYHLKVFWYWIQFGSYRIQLDATVIINKSIFTQTLSLSFSLYS